MASLPDGSVLAAGGRGNGPGAESSAEVYDPGTGVWTPTASMAQDRYTFAAVTLRDGRVMVAGGRSFNFPPGRNTAEIYDPVTATWSPAGHMTTDRVGPMASLLPKGNVLVVGGYSYLAGYHDVASAEVATNIA